MAIPSSDPNPMTLTREEACRLPLGERLAYFSECRLMHPRIQEVMKELEVWTQPNVGAELTLLIGPTGVGKSTIVQHLGEMLVQRHVQQHGEDSGSIPVVKVEAPAVGERQFSWRVFYQRLGEALQEPLMGRKQETVYSNGRVSVRPVSRGATVAGMRMAVENALRERKTSVVIVDEAVHMLRSLQGNTLENHMDALKSMANLCGVKLVLVGSYDLHALTHLSAQVARRTAIVHFQRYQTGNEADETSFRRAVKQFGRFLPLEGELGLESHALELQHACVGSVGILKESLSRGLARALQSGGKWSMSHLERGLLSPHQLDSILRETLEGEAKLQHTTSGTGSFRAAMRQTKEITLRMGEAV